MTSSPRYPQANGTAERAVKTVKQLLTKNQDPYLAMLTYRSTPLENGYSPAELLMGRKLRTTLPISKEQLQPSLPNAANLRRKERKMRNRMKRNFDKRHGARNLKPLSPGDTVWIPEREAGGTVEKESSTRSYTVQTEDGTLRRNRRDLILVPNTAEAQPSTNTESSLADQPQVESPSATDGTKTRSGRVSKPPDRLM